MKTFNILIILLGKGYINMTDIQEAKKYINNALSLDIFYEAFKELSVSGQLNISTFQQIYNLFS